jgi:hypothetical protein
MPDEIVAAIQKIVDYLHRDEELHFLDNHDDESHIFRSVALVETWLNNNDDDSSIRSLKATTKQRLDELLDEAA